MEAAPPDDVVAGYQDGWTRSPWYQCLPVGKLFLRRARCGQSVLATKSRAQAGPDKPPACLACQL